jgi:Spy/CpxP family protein refolding chaperone
MRKTVTVISLTLVLALMATAAFAGPGMWGGRFYGMGPAVPNLTPEQSSKILALQQAHYEEIIPIQEQLWAKKTELRGLWLTPNPDPEKVRTLQQDILVLVDQLQEKNTNLRLEIMKVITP